MKTTLLFFTLAFTCFCTTAVLSQSDAKISRNYANNLVGSSGVINPQYAVDNDRDNYSVLRADIGILNYSRITVGFSTPGNGGESVEIEIQNDNGILTADVLQSLSVAVYNSQGNKIVSKSGFNVTEAHLIEGTSRYLIGLKTKDSDLDISTVKITISGLVSAENRLRLYNVYIISTCPLIRGDAVHSSQNVTNAGNAISKDKNDYALLTPPLLEGNSFLDIAFSQPGVAGKKVGFNLGEGNALLDATLLTHITLTVYNTDGAVVITKSDFTLADAEVLPNGKFNLYVKTPKGDYQVGRGRITFSSFVNVLTTLKVYGINAHQNCNTQNVQKANANPVSLIDLQVSPNPFNAYTTLNIKSKLSNPVYVVISDKAGNIIEQHQTTGASSLHLLDKVPAGIYFLKITSGSYVETRKVIKM